MENQIVKLDTHKIKVISDTRLDKILEPLKKEIKLSEEFVNGSKKAPKKIIENIKIGDELSLKRNTKDKFNEFSIFFYNAENKKVGVMPEENTEIYARLMDAGKILKAKVLAKVYDEEYEYWNISATIYLIDF